MKLKLLQVNYITYIFAVSRDSCHGQKLDLQTIPNPFISLFQTIQRRASALTQCYSNRSCLTLTRCTTYWMRWLWMDASLRPVKPKSWNLSSWWRANDEGQWSMKDSYPVTLSRSKACSLGARPCYSLTLTNSAIPCSNNSGCYWKNFKITQPHHTQNTLAGGIGAYRITSICETVATCVASSILGPMV